MLPTLSLDVGTSMAARRVLISTGGHNVLHVEAQSPRGSSRALAPALDVVTGIEDPRYCVPRTNIFCNSINSMLPNRDPVVP
jgi:hypothetical protein